MNIKFILPLFFSALLMIANPAHAVLIGAGNGDLYDLDVTTNASTLLGNSGSTMYDIALDPTSSVLYGVAGGISLVSIDKTNGATSSIGALGAFINGLTFDSAGTLYGTGGTGLYTIDLVSGSATLIGNTGFTSAGDIAFDSSGNLFLSANGTGGGDQLVSLNTTTGAGSLIGNIGVSSVFGLNFSGSTLYGFTESGQTYNIDTMTGVGTFVANNTITAYGADGVGGVAVPAPSPIALMGLGILCFCFKRKN